MKTYLLVLTALATSLRAETPTPPVTTICVPDQLIAFAKMESEDDFATKGKPTEQSPSHPVPAPRPGPTRPSTLRSIFLAAVEARSTVNHAQVRKLGVGLLVCGVQIVGNAYGPV